MEIRKNGNETGVFLGFHAPFGLVSQAMPPNPGNAGQTLAKAGTKAYFF